MADFYKAIKHIIENEGGFSDHPADPGGTTKYGISLRFLKSEGIDINKDYSINKKDIQDLTLNDAQRLYQTYFWNPNKYEFINDQGIATKTFDLAVNIGASNANKILQKSLNATEGQPNLTVDGIIGGMSIDAANKANGKFLQDVMRIEAVNYYNQLIVNNSKLSVFRNGWMNRANKMYEV